MKSIKGLEGTRWFIWTIVSIVVILGGLATYIYYTTQMDSINLVSPIVNVPKKIKSLPTTTQTFVASDQSSESFLPAGTVGGNTNSVIPGKYSCGKYSVTMPSATASVEPSQTNLVLEPNGMLLLNTKNMKTFDYDAAFSKDCSTVYWGGYFNGKSSFKSYNIASGKTSTITVPLPAQIISANTTYSSPINYLYAIDSTHLFLGFYTCAGCSDINQAQDTYAVFDLTSGKPSFISLDNMPLLPLSYLNYINNTWTTPGDGYKNGIITYRIVTNLLTGQSTDIPLKKPLQYYFQGDTSDPCYSAYINNTGDPNQAEQTYQNCDEMYYSQLLE